MAKVISNDKIQDPFHGHRDQKEIIFFILKIILIYLWFYKG
jgi:hypothetical protein